MSERVQRSHESSLSEFLTLDAIVEFLDLIQSHVVSAQEATHRRSRRLIKLHVMGIAAATIELVLIALELSALKSGRASDVG